MMWIFVWCMLGAILTSMIDHRLIKNAKLPHHNRTWREEDKD